MAHSKDLCICGKLKDKRSKVCKSCANLDSCNPNWKGGITSKIYYCKDCGKEITINSGVYGLGRCYSCANKGNLSSHYKHGKYCGNNKCIDCGVTISPTAMRCYFCSNKLNAKSRDLNGNKNGMFGKVTHGKWGTYKGIKMRSSYEIKYAQFLDLSGYKWKYEPKAFNLGDSTYTPDFYIPEWDLYIEIKGYWRGDAKMKYIKFKKLYPKVRMKVLMQKDLQKIGILK